MKNSNGVPIITGACILLAALARLLPHPPNVTPIAAMALLGGAYLGRAQALAFPLIALFASDLVLGFHATMPFVYISFLATAMIGQMLRENRSAGRIGAACLASSLLFFIVTNAGTWWLQDIYSHDVSGLMACYTAALPFLRNSLLGDLLFTALLFGLERVSLRLFNESRVGVPA